MPYLATLSGTRRDLATLMDGDGEGREKEERTVGVGGGGYLLREIRERRCWRRRKLIWTNRRRGRGEEAIEGEEIFVI